MIVVIKNCQQIINYYFLKLLSKDKSYIIFDLKSFNGKLKMLAFAC